ncbi:hypothetical protein J2850_005268 [Azospirillum picis]|uniref:Uncharacterized protein n=2 Tax=Azospirillum picis TaxID=488438 RepID=A0ABU0MRW1_9PROT|nr:hypothetical protein [Azospirillum picis]MBP2302529.1 hypothetical protein [Azospirillum picis]MDQ0536229.1 hypothetical protein [Azospirillum picis]
MFSLGRDIVAELGPCAFALPATSATAGGAGDGTAANGVTIDLTALPGGVRAESIAFLIGAKATLAATKTLTVAARILTSPDGSVWTEAVASASILVLTGGAGGTTEAGTGRIGISLEYCKQFVRMEVTPDLSATATDTASLFGLAVFGGADRLP